ncbi:hypothetical protein JMJ77_0012326 [Colletotrichum scovillei]|uniref:Uncharacterized protein n=1 Tax=Colletotrichum scovillei TaxID=1209932 RepID=A0A9P7QVH3_9PEZI|nr:hypothetical protein JMJ78_0001381 [Colletotrichum scovillei]KAG7041808.1 hypothetical protein JMJ77_0012326 [Colletotrichum scovillei]KAG7061839.1 hypothetical protein JMJ76_0003795 [Colletotrichum scovillei]
MTQFLPRQSQRSGNDHKTRSTRYEQQLQSMVCVSISSLALPELGIPVPSPVLDISKQTEELPRDGTLRCALQPSKESCSNYTLLNRQRSFSGLWNGSRLKATGPGLRISAVHYTGVALNHPLKGP